MKKILCTFLLAACTFTMASAQTSFHGNKFFDNWYVGVNGGAGAVTTHQSVFKNLNYNAGFRVGKEITPFFALAAEANAYFSNKFRGENMTTGTVVRNAEIGLLTIFNMTNMFQTYYGEPRRFEYKALIGIDWGHNYGNMNEGGKLNTLVNRLGIDFCYNFGKAKEWQLFLEPSLNYVIAGTRDAWTYDDGNGNKRVLYDINSSYMQLNVGINYKLMTSNGTHNFAVVEQCNMEYMDSLNNVVNDLRQKAQEDEGRLVVLQKKRQELKDDLVKCETKEAVVKEKLSIPELPAVFYQVNKSIITPAQKNNVAVAAEVLKNHPEYNILIKGYASPEGPHANNTSLGIRRAGAVKTMLINTYKIAADRITAEGCGETDELFPVYEFNRVAVMSLQKKDEK